METLKSQLELIAKQAPNLLANFLVLRGEGPLSSDMRDFIESINSLAFRTEQAIKAIDRIKAVRQ